MTTTRILTIAVDDTCEMPKRQIAEVIHRAIPGSHTVSNVATHAYVSDFEWDDNEPHPLPLTREAAQNLAGDDGLITVVTTVDQDALMHARTSGLRGGDDEHDLVHEQTFSFGLPHACNLQILAVTDDSFVIAYTTDVTVFLEAA